MNTTLVNAVPVSITYRDGRTETLELKELTIRQLYQFIEHFGQSNTPALVALAAGKDLDWADTLSDASFGELAKQTIKANFPRAAAMINQDITVAAKLAPTLHRLAMAETMLTGVPSSDKLPAPVALVSAPAIGKKSSTSRQRD